MAFLSRLQVESLGFAEVGNDVFISDMARFHGTERIRLGNSVRIDDFCVLSAGAGGIDIGDHVHVAVYTSIIGAGSVSIGSFANLSSRVSIYSSSDDYSGRTMTNPMVPDEFKNVHHADVRIGRHVIVGSGSILLPGVKLADGVAVGALSLVRDDCAEFTIYVGVPARAIGERKRDVLDAERLLRAR